MVRSLNTAVQGLNAIQGKLDVIANNISNVDTVGYKGARADFAETLNQLERAPGSNGYSGIQVGTGVTTSATQTNFGQGVIKQTGIATDLALAGDGYFIVRNVETNEYFVTRAGNFKLDANNYLVTAQGYRVQGVADVQADNGASAIDAARQAADGKPAQALPRGVGDIRFDRGTLPPGTVVKDSQTGAFSAPPSESDVAASVIGIDVDTSGRVNVRLDNGTQYTRAQILLQRFNNPQSLTKVGDNLYSNTAQAGPQSNATVLNPATGGQVPEFVSAAGIAAPSLLLGAVAANQDGTASVQSKSLELSNVDLAGEFSDMIITQRAFQANSRVITTSDEMLQEIVNLKR